jgi:hypothetical protein
MQQHLLLAGLQSQHKAAVLLEAASLQLLW